MNKQLRSFKLIISWLAMANLLCIATPASAALTIAETPLFLTTSGVKPNIVITLDDSGSMTAASVPDGISGQHALRAFKSATYNALYYNPRITYTPPPRYNGNKCFNNASNPASCWPNISFTAAPLTGFFPGTGAPIDLDTNYRATRDYTMGSTSQSIESVNALAYTRAITYSYPTTSCNITFDDASSNDRIVVNTGCNGLFTNLLPGATLTVNCSGCSNRNGVYTVVGSVDSTNRRIPISIGGTTNPWSSDVPNINATVSFTHNTTVSVRPAYYYLFYTDAGVSLPAGCAGAADVANNSCYVGAVVGYATPPAGTPAGTVGDITPGTLAEKQQNFANWYSYYRNRTLALGSGAMRGLATLDQDFRVAWQSFNTCRTLPTSGSTIACRGWDNPTASYDNRIRRLNAVLGNGRTHKQALYDYLASMSNVGGTGTDLLNSSRQAGDFFSFTGANVFSPYAEDPQITIGTIQSCRRNVHVIMTDGLWNDTPTSTLPNGATLGNSGSTAVTVPSGPLGADGLPTGPFLWTPTYPYQDTNSNDLSDIAFYYWSRDLQPALSNTIQPIYRDTTGATALAVWVNPKNNPATWQNMTTYSMGLGLGSTLVAPNPVWGGSTYAGDYPKLVSGPMVSGGRAWPVTGSNFSPGNVYDLWHAAISGRGQFFSADSPQDIVRAVTSIASDITGQDSSASALASSSTVLLGAVVYQAQFNSREWSGNLYEFPVSANGAVVDVNGDGKLNLADANWDVATKVPAPSARKIFTTNTVSAAKVVQAFDSGACTGTLKTALDKDVSGNVDNRCVDRINWLRGDSVKEDRFANGIFRSRPTSVIGDMINSSPTYVSNENFGYDSLPGAEGTAYPNFVTLKASRPAMIYVGANDGMLHAFADNSVNANAGKELFAYVPSTVHDNLSALTDPLYAHKAYVDGSPNVRDAYLGGSWKTILVNGLGGGGRSVFALDITSPTTFTASEVLWEFTDPDMGLSYSQPQIVRTNDPVNPWVAVFGNGYNSPNDNAYLFIVNLQTGTLVRKIAMGSATGNGLSTPRLYDANNDRIIDAIYAGDLKGNLWKIDITSSLSSSWTASVLFTATSASSQVQPITAQPRVAQYNLGTTTGALVYFGTGEYITTGAVNDLTVQSFYAIWDTGTVTTVNRSELQPQTITAETTQSFTNTVPNPDVTFEERVRETSNNTVDYAGGKRGWYLDLKLASATANGERVVVNALVRGNNVIFVTVVPASSDKCVPGGESWLMELDAANGARPVAPTLDLNRDNLFNGTDILASGFAASGIRSKVGIFGGAPVVLSTSTQASNVAGRVFDNGVDIGFGATSTNGAGNGVVGGISDGEKEGYKLLPGSSTKIESHFDCFSPPCNPPPGTTTRIYWQQIQ